MSRSPTVSRPRRKLPATSTRSAPAASRRPRTIPHRDRVGGLVRRPRGGGGPSDRLDPGANLGDLLRTEPFHPGEAPRVDRREELGRSFDPELRPEPPGRLRTETGDAQKVRHSRGDVASQPLEVVDATGREVLPDLLLDRVADAGDRPELPTRRGGGEVLRQGVDRAGRPTVRLRFEAFAEHVEQVGDRPKCLGRLRIRRHRGPSERGGISQAGPTTRPGPPRNRATPGGRPGGIRGGRRPPGPRAGPPARTTRRGPRRARPPAGRPG